MTLQANAIRKTVQNERTLHWPWQSAWKFGKNKSFFLMLNTFAAFVVMVKLIVLGWYLL